MNVAILIGKEHAAIAIAAISSRTASFLIVSLQGPGHIVVGNVTDIGLVDSHSKRVGGHDRVQITAHELFLHLSAVLRVHSAVVHTDFAFGQSGQQVSDLFASFSSRCVDDSRTLLRGNVPDQGFLLIGVGFTLCDAKSQIGACKPGHKYFWIIKLQQLTNVIAHHRRGGRSQRDGLHRGQVAFSHLPQTGIVGTKVMAPFADAVRLINSQQRHLRAAQGFQEPAVSQAFRRDVNQLVFARRHRRHDLLLLSRGQRRID